MSIERELFRDAATDPRIWGLIADNYNDVGDDACAEGAQGLASIDMRFTWCPPGTFLMGSPPEEVGRYDDEVQHRVMLTKGFYLGVHPVTQAQWRAVMGSNPSWFKGDNLPVENVSWYDCQAFCKKLGGLVRLPTEAEWEYACRAGTTTVYHTGDDEEALSRAGWYYTNSGGQTRPVGELTPNAWGLYDMHGNVWEWCADWHDEYSKEEVAKGPCGPFAGSVEFYAAARGTSSLSSAALPAASASRLGLTATAGCVSVSTRTDPVGPATGTRRVLRGGSWYYLARGSRAASRDSSAPADRNSFYGLRVAVLPA